MTHPHPLLSVGVPATPQESSAVTSNDYKILEAKPYCLLLSCIIFFSFLNL